MSGRSWVIADPHFGHANILNFLTADGTKLRPFSSVDEMDYELVTRWNSVVEPKDRVYLLGDVAMRREGLKTLERLNGRICLVKGNHDIFKPEEYLKYCDDIRAYVVGKTKGGHKYILSHIPIHKESLGRFGINIHGHLHSNVVKDNIGKPDPQYKCVSVEHTDFYPVLLSSLI